jgi:hypothetical protein
MKQEEDPWPDQNSASASSPASVGSASSVHVPKQNIDLDDASR